ncbi:DUF3592 domain-containing protein [Siphonobacter sp. SORGH_AS_0500]|uniref:DUF3592 domain-containing protein n=1 Tax=Siphonobacter sp. SORGH_AS_0500 TaxID=1864824 RepID=UPI0028654207|nr:DUF3592 domain-containing protein [Siphonobacter sp. SORGH_AS_0500]MDR6195450.1 hypothetical protein [Siphonobacter sp. SORGH_AS_0500]
MNLFFNNILTMSLPRTPGMTQPGAEFMLPFIGIAILCLGVGFYFANRRQQWLQQSATAEGVVVEVFKKYNRDDKMGNYPLHFPQVKFNVGNHQFLALGEEGFNNPLQVGSRIPVRYNVGNPEDATLGTEHVPGVQPKVFYIVSGLFFAIGVLFAL